MKVLLVEPRFPYPIKSKNQANGIHKNFVPIGLLKLGAYYKSLGYKVKLVRGNLKKKDIGIVPSMILVTSLFTYWSELVWDAVRHYRKLFPRAKITIGGVYATLHCKKVAFRKNLRKYQATYYKGLHSKAERFYPDYTLLNGKVDHHITHAMRGCIRKCTFCGVWKIEPKRSDKNPKQLFEEIKRVGKNKVIFFDNNFLANKNVKEILVGLAKLKVNDKSVIFESQSGFDGRLLQKNPELATLLKRARFSNIRIAWDNSLSDASCIKTQIDCLVEAGYNLKDISVFMIYNFNVTHKTMRKKLSYCKKWGVQIADCRFRPLNSLKDNYDSNKYKTGQTKDEYYIHEKAGWTDEKIRDFRRNVRQHNIWVRYAKARGLEYDRKMEKWSSIHTTYKYFGMGRPPQLEAIENSSSRTKRVRVMNRVKDYYRRNNQSPPDFSGFTMKQIDEELKNILETISNNS